MWVLWPQSHSMFNFSARSSTKRSPSQWDESTPLSIHFSFQHFGAERCSAVTSGFNRHKQQKALTQLYGGVPERNSDIQERNSVIPEPWTSRTYFWHSRMELWHSVKKLWHSGMELFQSMHDGACLNSSRPVGDHQIVGGFDLGHFACWPGGTFNHGLMWAYGTCFILFFTFVVGHSRTMLTIAINHNAQYLW